MVGFGSHWYQIHRWVLAWRWHMVGFGSNCYHIHTISSRTRCRGAATLPACSLLRLAKKYREDKYDDCATITAQSAKKKKLVVHHLSVSPIIICQSAYHMPLTLARQAGPLRTTQGITPSRAYKDSPPRLSMTSPLSQTSPLSPLFPTSRPRISLTLTSRPLLPCTTSPFRSQQATPFPTSRPQPLPRLPGVSRRCRMVPRPRPRRRGRG